MKIAFTVTDPSHALGYGGQVESKTYIAEVPNVPAPVLKCLERSGEYAPSIAVSIVVEPKDQPK